MSGQRHRVRGVNRAEGSGGRSRRAPIRIRPPRGFVVGVPPGTLRNIEILFLAGNQISDANLRALCLLFAFGRLPGGTDAVPRSFRAGRVGCLAFQVIREYTSIKVGRISVGPVCIRCYPVKISRLFYFFLRKDFMNIEAIGRSFRLSRPDEYDLFVFANPYPAREVVIFNGVAVLVRQHSEITPLFQHGNNGLNSIQLVLIHAVAKTILNGVGINFHVPDFSFGRGENMFSYPCLCRCNGA